jgi:hypothetical protein
MADSEVFGELVLSIGQQTNAAAKLVFFIKHIQWLPVFVLLSSPEVSAVDSAL